MWKKTDWFKIGKGEHQGCILSPAFFNLYTEYFIQNPGLDKVQAEINITRRNSNTLRHGADTTLMAESARNLPLDEGQRGGEI